MKTGAGDPLRVYLERGTRRTFAMALDWPGLGRSGRGDEAALEALLAYLPRYAAVARAAGLEFSVDAPPDVVLAVPGNATTDFGAPGVVPPPDDDGTWRGERSQRGTALLQACWDQLDAVAAAAPEELRKGPRGGGRDTSGVVRHVNDAETAYARKGGLRLRAPGDRDAVLAQRAAIVATLGGSDGAAPGPRGWPASYVVRRSAWHVLDHAWEIEDRSGPQP